MADSNVVELLLQAEPRPARPLLPLPCYCVADLAVADRDDGGSGVAAGAELPRHLHQPDTTVVNRTSGHVAPPSPYRPAAPLAGCSELSQDLGSPPAAFQLFISLRMWCDVYYYERYPIPTNSLLAAILNKQV